ncbi:MAG: DUF7239 family protein [Bacteroidota bacterium]
MEKSMKAKDANSRRELLPRWAQEEIKSLEEENKLLKNIIYTYKREHPKSNLWANFRGPDFMMYPLYLDDHITISVQDMNGNILKVNRAMGTGHVQVRSSEGLIRILPRASNLIHVISGE